MLTMGKSKDNSMKIYSVKDKEFNEFGKVVNSCFIENFEVVLTFAEKCVILSLR